MEGVLRQHYERLWGVPSREAEFRKEDGAVRVLKWDADARTGDVVMYATLGASAHPVAGRSMSRRLEYFLGLLPQQDDVAATLALLGPATWAEPMADGHTVEVEGVLWPGTTMNCWLLAEPQEPTVPSLLHRELHVEWLQAVPLYPSERTWKAVHGAEALWARWQADVVPFWKPEQDCLGRRYVSAVLNGHPGITR